MACDALLTRYCKARDAGDSEAERLEGEVLAAHRGLALACAHRSGQGTDHEQAAMVGLLRAVRDFDPERATELSTFAWPRMLGELAQASIASATVRVPRTSYRAGVRPLLVDADKQSLGAAASAEEDLAAVEDETALASVVECWRGADRQARCLAGAEALAASSSPSLWPRDPDQRMEVLARLDAALDQLGHEHPVDAAIWRGHHLDGRQWTDLAAEHGVTRQRVAHRARRREPRLAEILTEMLSTPRDAMVLWARRPPVVEALEQLGLADGTTPPLELSYLAEDLEVALTEIDERAAEAWSARELGKRAWSAIAVALGTTGKVVRRLVDRGAQALVELLAPGSSCAAQLEINLQSGAEGTVHWWSPVTSPPHPSGAFGAPWNAGVSASRGGLGWVVHARHASTVLGSNPGRPSLSGRRRSWLSASAVLHDTDVRGVGPPLLDWNLQHA